jgi:hypothetical protein
MVTVPEQSGRTRGLIPFQKGQSGNPSGRAKRKPVTEALLAELAKSHGRNGQTKLQAMVARLVKTVISGKGKEAVEAAKLIMTYTDGLPVQMVEIDVYDAARRLAEERGLDPDKVIGLFDAIRAKRAG